MTIGFFGKVPSHGDFVGRGLPPAMHLPFDAWVQAGLRHSKADLGERWLAAWLVSPIWRFVLGAGVCGPQAWAGVMMPSMDRVGRCFPLVVAMNLAGVPTLQDCLTPNAGWYARLEWLALSSLDDGFHVDAFDSALATVDGAPWPAPWLEGDEELDGCSVWWTDGAPGIAPCSARCAGLPPAAHYGAFVDGHFPARGWPTCAAPCV